MAVLFGIQMNLFVYLTGAVVIGLPGIMIQQLSLGCQYDIHPWQLRYLMDYTGKQTANYPYGSTNVGSIGGYVVHNVSVTREIQKDSTCYFEHQQSIQQGLRGAVQLSYGWTLVQCVFSTKTMMR